MEYSNAFPVAFFADGLHRSSGEMFLLIVALRGLCSLRGFM